MTGDISGKSAADHLIFGFTMGSNENEDDLDDVFSAEESARGVVSDDDDDVGFVFVPISTNNTSTTSRFDE